MWGEFKPSQHPISLKGHWLRLLNQPGCKATNLLITLFHGSNSTDTWSHRHMCNPVWLEKIQINYMDYHQLHAPVNLSALLFPLHLYSMPWLWVHFHNSGCLWLHPEQLNNLLIFKVADFSPVKASSPRMDLFSDSIPTVSTPEINLPSSQSSCFSLKKSEQGLSAKERFRKCLRATLSKETETFILVRSCDWPRF